MSDNEQTYIKVQTLDFSFADEHQSLIENNTRDGAVVTFSGLVRDMNLAQSVTSLYLEHYPAMTEKSLRLIVKQARERWPLGRVRIIHRVGKLLVSEKIVFVGVTSQHRGAAFQGAEFIMDYLKTQAPFWKKEAGRNSEHWVQSKDSDMSKAKAWQN